MKITITKGKCISHYSHQGVVKNENEVLFAPNTEFLVVEPLTEENITDPWTGSNIKMKVIHLCQIEESYIF